jgi:hypothetical protein
MAGAKVMLPMARVHEYTDSAAGSRHFHLHGAYTYMKPPRGRAPSTPTFTRTPRQGGTAFTSSLLRHPHQHHRHRPCADEAKPYSTDMSFSDEVNYHLLCRRGKGKSPRPTPTRRAPLGQAPTRQRPPTSSSSDIDKPEGYGYASLERWAYSSTLQLHQHTIITNLEKTRLEDDDHCSSLIGGGLWA